MGFLNNLKSAFETWMAGLEPSDQVTMMAVGLGLMIFSVAALIWQRHRDSQKATAPRGEAMVQSAQVAVPGERHMVAPQKGDAFLRRIDRMV